MRTYPSGYKVPLHNVLLISCMDLRLLDNIVHFMEHENLTNRYDHYIMAGASLGALVGSAENDDEIKYMEAYKGWETGLLQHVDLAIQLHAIQDIYILEHQHCGAYRAFLKDGLGNYENRGLEQEYADHQKFAQRLSDRLQDYLLNHSPQTKSSRDESNPSRRTSINIHSFLMDIRGNVALLSTTAPALAIV